MHLRHKSIKKYFKHTNKVNIMYICPFKNTNLKVLWQPLKQHKTFVSSKLLRFFVFKHLKFFLLKSFQKNSNIVCT